MSHPSSSSSPRYTKTELNSMKVNELRELLESLNIHSKGTKTELVNRAVKANIRIEGEKDAIDVPDDLKYKLLSNYMTTGPFYLQMQYALAGKDRVRIQELNELAHQVTINVSSNTVPRETIEKDAVQGFYDTVTNDENSSNWTITIENDRLLCFMQKERIYIKFKTTNALVEQERNIIYLQQTQPWDLILHYIPSKRNSKDITIVFVHFVYRNMEYINTVQDLLLGLWWVKKWIFTSIKFSKLMETDNFKVTYLRIGWREPDETPTVRVHAEQMLGIMKKVVK
jgi:hypothetical protein